ncbi:hypothetical protein F383_20339 [Gossypium arboreum]|uniref:Uncharacterized protein n=1 Tax=Gossypium arboreum TaxID=29729 RepID=A0A0B0NKD9_GOSAR|nr:hypothetical protein F383_20339 [Gossypium arboreum]
MPDHLARFTHSITTYHFPLNHSELNRILGYHTYRTMLMSQTLSYM